MLMHQSRSASVRVVGTALVIAAASLFASVASAKGDDGVSTVVRYRDLDPSQASDAQRLYARLKYASKVVCGSYDTRGLHMKKRLDACVDEALTKAVEKVNEPQLTALHAAEPRMRVARKS
jgi:UrcA family protein